MQLVGLPILKEMLAWQQWNFRRQKQRLENVTNHF
jgi:hypothetical protein